MLQETRATLQETPATLNETPATLRETRATLHETRATLHERLDYKLSAFRILHTIPHVHSAFYFPHCTFPHYTDTHANNGVV